MIDKREFRRAMVMLGLEVHRREVDRLFDSFDPDGGGTIDYKELNTALKRRAEIDASLRAGAAGAIETKSQNKSSRDSLSMAQANDSRRQDLGDGWNVSSPEGGMATRPHSQQAARQTPSLGPNTRPESAAAGYYSAQVLQRILPAVDAADDDDANADATDAASAVRSRGGGMSLPSTDRRREMPPYVSAHSRMPLVKGLAPGLARGQSTELGSRAGINFAEFRALDLGQYREEAKAVARNAWATWHDDDDADDAATCESDAAIDAATNADVSPPLTALGDGERVGVTPTAATTAAEDGELLPSYLEYEHLHRSSGAARPATGIAVVPGRAMVDPAAAAIFNIKRHVASLPAFQRPPHPLVPEPVLRVRGGGGGGGGGGGARAKSAAALRCESSGRQYALTVQDSAVASAVEIGALARSNRVRRHFYQDSGLLRLR